VNTPIPELAESAAPQGVQARWGSAVSPDLEAARLRLLAYVEVTPTCWLWTGTFYTQFGKPTYGQAYLNRKRMGAHRLSYIVHVGPIPDGLDILHSCDNPPCVNPAHLSPGTHRQNIADARARHGEWSPYGEKHGRARLSQADVDTIRAELAKGAYQRVLAERYGVTQAHISHIAKVKRWNVTRPESAEVAA